MIFVFALTVTSKPLRKNPLSSIFRNRTTRKTPRVFGAPLDMVIVNNELPDILQVKYIYIYINSNKKKF